MSDYSTIRDYVLKRLSMTDAWWKELPEDVEMARLFTGFNPAAPDLSDDSDPRDEALQWSQVAFAIVAAGAELSESKKATALKVVFTIAGELTGAFSSGGPSFADLLKNLLKEIAQLLKNEFDLRETDEQTDALQGEIQNFVIDYYNDRKSVFSDELLERLPSDLNNKKQDQLRAFHDRISKHIDVFESIIGRLEGLPPELALMPQVVATNMMLVAYDEGIALRRLAEANEIPLPSSEALQNTKLSHLNVAIRAARDHIRRFSQRVIDCRFFKDSWTGFQLKNSFQDMLVLTAEGAWRQDNRKGLEDPPPLPGPPGYFLFGMYMKLKWAFFYESLKPVLDTICHWERIIDEHVQAKRGAEIRRLLVITETDGAKHSDTGDTIWLRLRQKQPLQNSREFQFQNAERIVDFPLCPPAQYRPSGSVANYGRLSHNLRGKQATAIFDFKEEAPYLSFRGVPEYDIDRNGKLVPRPGKRRCPFLGTRDLEMEIVNLGGDAWRPAASCRWPRSSTKNPPEDAGKSSVFEHGR